MPKMLVPLVAIMADGEIAGEFIEGLLRGLLNVWWVLLIFLVVGLALAHLDALVTRFERRRGRQRRRWPRRFR